LERLPDLVAELVQLKPDLLVAAACGPGLVALRRATSTLPILVQTCQDDMVKAGIVASLARPGGNVTGISKAGAEWAAKKLQLLKEAIPSASRVAVLWDPTYSDWTGDWQEIRRAAHGLGVTLESVEMKGRDDLTRIMREPLREPAFCLVCTALAAL
jgi:putative ABC transport system substrate-binding protein